MVLTAPPNRPVTLIPVESKEAFQARLMNNFKIKYLSQYGLYLYMCQCCKSENYLHQAQCGDCGFKNEYLDSSISIPEEVTKSASIELIEIKFSEAPI